MENNRQMMDISSIYGIRANPYPDSSIPQSMQNSYNRQMRDRIRNPQISQNCPQNLTGDSNTVSLSPNTNMTTVPNNNMMQNMSSQNSAGSSQMSNMPSNQHNMFDNSFNVTPNDVSYLNDFMKTQIGKPISIDFLIGDHNLLNESGILIGIGANYILIHNDKNNNITACDSSGIKFVRFMS